MLWFKGWLSHSVHFSIWQHHSSTSTELMRDNTSSEESQRLCSAKPAIPAMTGKKKSLKTRTCIIWSIQYGVFESPLERCWENNWRPSETSTPRKSRITAQKSKKSNCAWEKSRRKLWLMAPFGRKLGHQGSSLKKRSTKSGNPCPKSNAQRHVAGHQPQKPRTRNGKPQFFKANLANSKVTSQITNTKSELDVGLLFYF